MQDYDDPEDFYYDHADEFDDIQDAEDYWEEAQWEIGHFETLYIY